MSSGLVVARPGLVREGLQAVLSAIPGMNALEPASDGASVLDKLVSHCPDLVILDSSLPEDELRAALRHLKEQHPDVRCVVIASSPQQARALEATDADAILVEGSSTALLSTTIKALLTQT